MSDGSRCHLHLTALGMGWRLQLRAHPRRTLSGLVAEGRDTAGSDSCHPLHGTGQPRVWHSTFGAQNLAGAHPPGASSPRPKYTQAQLQVYLAPRRWWQLHSWK